MGYTNSFSLTAGTATNFLLYYYSAPPEYDEVYNNGIHVTASGPVSVYGQCYDPYLSWGFTGWPTPMLGTNYCVLARPSLAYNDTGHSYSQFAILGTASNTTVHILPSATANLATNAGSNALFTITLQPGWTYEINSSTIADDVTGTWITSDKPIAVYAGANIAYVPDEIPTNSGPGNPLVQEQIPVSSWGNQALSLSFGRPGGDDYRILAVTNSTVVITTTNGVVTNALQAGQPYDAILDGPVEFQADNPIQVAQISQGANTDTNGPGINPVGDPCEILLPPTGHYLTSYAFTVPDYTDSYNQPFENFVNLVVPHSARSTALLDGTNISANNFQPISNSGYSAARLPVAPGTHTLSSSQPMEVEVYGFGFCDIYGFIGGVTIFP
jgi:hypothetical protein